MSAGNRGRDAVIIGVITLALLLIVGEGYSRWKWDKRIGNPGLALPHPTRDYVLAPHYEGWFEGQPLKINNLGFRDDRDYSLSKPPGTFRILMLGDSVTFGHGCRYEETWPYLLEQQLKNWRPSVNWQVWNLGVPGYDSVSELRTLEELGPKYQPDLVVVGFYENDLISNPYQRRSSKPDWMFAVEGFLKKHFYLYTQLRRVYKLRFLVSFESWCPVEREIAFLHRSEVPRADLEHFPLKHQAATTRIVPPPAREEFNPLDKKQFSRPKRIPDFERAIQQFGTYQREGKYRLVFFINIAPDESGDRFVNGIHNGMNTYLKKTLGKAAPVVSSYDAFWSYHPSEVPQAGGHSLGTANLVKAHVLFDFLSTRLLRHPLVVRR